MGAKALIEAAMTAAEVYGQAKANMQAAGQALAQAQTDLDAANLAVHDYLTANGMKLYFDEDADSYYVCAASEPNTFTMTPIELAA